MTLVQSWIDSLRLLQPKNLQRFIAVTVKSIIEVYALMIQYFWPSLVMLVICFFVPYLFPRIDIPIKGDTIFGVNQQTFNHFARHIAFFASCWIYELLFLLVCFSARLSVSLKDGSYFAVHLKRIIPYWLFVPLFSWSSSAYYLYIFTVLFFADSPGNPKSFFLSIWNGIKMVVFNFPLVVLMGALVYGSGLAGTYLLLQSYMSYGIPVYPEFLITLNLIGALLLPIGVSLFTNIYIERCAAQSYLYATGNTGIRG